MGRWALKARLCSTDCMGTCAVATQSRRGTNPKLKPDRKKIRRRQPRLLDMFSGRGGLGKRWRVGEGGRKKSAVLIFWSLHFPSGLVSNKLPRTHPCTHQSHYPSPPSRRHWVNSTVCRETKNQQHNETADDELGVCVYVPACKCLLAVFLPGIYLLRLESELALT